jgi:hypothetical protein
LNNSSLNLSKDFGGVRKKSENQRPATAVAHLKPWNPGERREEGRREGGGKRGRKREHVCERVPYSASNYIECALI